MRLSKLFTIIEQADPNKVYVIGDSHARAIGTGISGAEVLARDGATLDQILAQAQSVPDGSRVLFTGGANDWSSQELAAAEGVKRIVRELKRRGCAVVYVSFPPIDLNGAYADDYAKQRIDHRYNRVQQKTAGAAKSALGQNNVIGLTMADINPADPMKIHAKPQAYSRLADAIKQRLSAAKTGTAQSSEERIVPDNVNLDLSRVPPEDLPYIDQDGDGVVTAAEAKGLGLDSSVYSTSGDFYGIFGVLQNFINSTRPVNPEAPAYKTFMQRAKAAGLPSQPKAVPVSGNAGRALRYFQNKGFTPEQAAGIVGNLQAESGVKLNPAAVGDGGKAWGIAQWHPARRAIWEKATGKQWRIDGTEPNFDEQIVFIMYELQRTESRAMKRLRATTSVEDAAIVFDKYYERSSGAHRQKRVDLAQKLLSTTTTATADASGVPTSGNPLFGLDGASRMTQDDAAEQMAQTLNRYKRMVAKLSFPVRINDAIAKAGTSRERETPGSQHFHGTALDLSIRGLSKDQVKQLLAAAKSVGFTGFGFGASILHVDSGPKRVWDYGNRDFAGMNLQSVKNWAMA